MTAPASALRSARAWMLDVGLGFPVAVGAHHVVEYLLAPTTVAVPRTPACAPGVLLWRDQMIPWIIFAPLVSVRAAPEDERPRAVVLAWQDAPGEALHYGALTVHAAPKEVFVTDDMASTAPRDPAAIRRLSLASFSFGGQSVPVLDVARLFGQPLLDVHLKMDTSTTRVPAPAEPVLPTADVAVAPAPWAGTLPAVAPRRPGIGPPPLAVGAVIEGAGPAPRARLEDTVPPPLPVTPPLDAGPVVDPAVDRTPDDMSSSVAEPAEVTPPAAPISVPQAGPNERRNTSQSLETLKRRRALEHRRRDDHRRRARTVKAGVAVAAVMILLAAMGWRMIVTPAPPAEPMEPVVTTITNDVAPGAVEASLAPAAPVQPPN